MLKYRVNVSIADKNDNTPIDIIRQSKNPNLEIMRIFENFSKQKVKTEKKISVKKNKQEIDRQLWVECKQENPNLETCQKLLENGANPNMLSENNKTPLHSASNFSANLDLISLLLNFGADSNLRDTEQMTPIYGYCLNKNSNLDGLKKILKYGCKVNQKIKKLKTKLKIKIQIILKLKKIKKKLKNKIKIKKLK